MQLRTLLALNSLLSKNIALPTLAQIIRNCSTVQARDSESKKMKTAPKIKLNNGLEMPAIGLGTWLAQPGVVESSVKQAIKAGYRHVDCAMVYDNEKEVGDGICELINADVIKREDLFVTTKLWNTFHEREVVVDTCRKSLKNFGFDYIDLYLVHWPVAMKTKGGFNVQFPFADAEGYDYDFLDTWKGMEECVNLGLAKSIGVSNFNKEQLERLLGNCCIKPVTNQIEVNLFNNQKKMIEFCKQHELVVTAYSPFSSPAREWKKEGEPEIDWKDEKLVKIADAHCKNVGQVLLRYVVQLGAVPIPKSVHEKRIHQNFDVFDFELTDEEMCVLDGYNVDFRAISAPEMKDMPNYPFHNWI